MCVFVAHRFSVPTDIFTALSVQFPRLTPLGSKRVERTNTIPRYRDYWQPTTISVVVVYK